MSDAQRPSLGRIVHFRGHEHNGSKVHPAIITRVWTDQMVNLTVFPDFGVPYTAGSVSHSDDEASTYGWFWPPRA